MKKSPDRTSLQTSVAILGLVVAGSFMFIRARVPPGMLEHWSAEPAALDSPKRSQDLVTVSEGTRRLIALGTAPLGAVSLKSRTMAYSCLVEKSEATERVVSGTTGVEIPRPAVVWYEGRAWVYVQISEDRFQKRPVSPGIPTENGWFASAGFLPGEDIVVSGAQMLLSIELKDLISAGI